MGDREQEKEQTEGLCRFNSGVLCQDTRAVRCAGCGWNPKVQAERKRRRRQHEE